MTGLPAALSVDNEFGALYEVVLSRPILRAEDRSFLQNWNFPDPSLAMEQHRALVSILDKEQVHCRFVAADNDVPFQCYMRDSAVSTPWGLLICNMAFENRQSEPARIRHYAETHDVSIWHEFREGVLEGGDVQVLRPGYAAVGFNNIRTTKASALTVRRWFTDEGWECRLIENRSPHYHIDVVFSVLDDSTIICAEGFLSTDDLAWFDTAGFDIMFVSQFDANNMACNVVSLGKKRILSSLQAAVVNASLRKRGYIVREPDLSEFVRDGGGPHCLVLPWRRESAMQSDREQITPQFQG